MGLRRQTNIKMKYVKTILLCLVRDVFFVYKKDVTPIITLTLPRSLLSVLLPLRLFFLAIKIFLKKYTSSRNTIKESSSKTSCKISFQKST